MLFQLSLAQACVHPTPFPTLLGLSSAGAMAVVGAPQPGAAYAHLDEAGRDAHMGKVFTRAVTLAPHSDFCPSWGCARPRFRASL